MKNFIFSICLISIISLFTSVYGQLPPAIADNATPQNNDIKMRSVELERIKKESAIAEASTFAPINTEMSKKFPQIKEDFEGIQMAQSAIITAYTKNKTIDYVLIETSANNINKNAKRLDTNLFAASKKNKEKKENKEEKPKTIKELIIELDNTIGSFVSSKIFANLKVIEPEIAIKTRTDLLRIQELSEKLAKEAKNLK